MSESGRTDFWINAAMEYAGMSFSELARLVYRVPALAAEAERIKREVPIGQAQAWAFLDAVRRARQSLENDPIP